MKSPMQFQNSNVLLKIQWIFYFTQPFCHKNFRGACSSFEILKAYMFRERLGTPGLNGAK